MFMDALLDIIYSKHDLYRKDYKIVAKYRGCKELHKMSTIDLINALYRNNIKRKSYNIRRKFRRLKLNSFTKKQNVLENDLCKAKKLHNLFARLGRIKNYDGLSREDLIYTLLRSESNLVESNYMKYINNVTDNEIKAKINNIRLTLAGLGK